MYESEFDQNSTMAKASAPLNRPARIDGPLTQEVMETLNRAQDTANEVRHRLWQLRDRLIGSPPPTDATANGKQAEAPHFKAAHGDRSAALLGTLADIDAISSELANRL